MCKRFRRRRHPLVTLPSAPRATTHQRISGRAEIAKMIDYFSKRPSGTTEVHIPAYPVPPHYTESDATEEGYVWCLITGFGEVRKAVVKASVLHPLAFDEADGHLSFQFKSRLYYLRFSSFIERVIAARVQADTVEKKLYSIDFQRYIPEIPTRIDVPVTLVGFTGSQAFRRSYHVELTQPTVPCMVTGTHFPKPFWLDVAYKRVKPDTISAIYLEALQPQLPKDGSITFPPDINTKTFEVAWIYGRGTLDVIPRPPTWQDPNFLNKRGQPIQLTYKGSIPKVQATLKKKKTTKNKSSKKS